MVSRSGGSTGAVSVAYLTVDGSAKAGTDYTSASGTINWAAGDASTKSVSVTIGTTAFEGTKTFSFTLENVMQATLGTPSSTVVTIEGSSVAQSPAAVLGAKLGKSHFMVGIGTQGSDPIAAVESQRVTVEIYDRYLGSGDWTQWNSEPCDYVCVIASGADQIGAIPMYTQYQMANNGDGNLSGLTQSSFMSSYWARAKQMFQSIAAYKKPALINVEPDFWGYVERSAPNADPTQMTVLVNSNPDCSGMPNDVTGFAACFLAMARKYAPNAYVGIPPSPWGGNTTADVVNFMNAVGAQHADFIVEETLDRDAGCDEAQAPGCTNTGAVYWDETNQTHPNFTDHLNEANAWHVGIGNLPIIWWQTPMGVPSTTPGGTPYHYRDNRMHYFLNHVDQLVAVGGLGVAFSSGAQYQTDMTTDGGQYQSLSNAYFAHPVALQ